MTDGVSDQVIDQRLRNRMSEALLMLVEWEDALAAVGPEEYFNAFFDWFPPVGNPPLWPNLTLIDREKDLLTVVRVLMDEAAEATPQNVTHDQLAASGWPQKIAVAAKLLSS